MVNWVEAAECKRCGALFGGMSGSRVERSSGGGGGERSLLKRVLFVAGMVGLFVFGSCVSLRVTSEPVTVEQRQLVGRAIDLLEQKGYGGRTFILKNLVSYRASDNWWNRYVGHTDAFAATNFPFEVVTLYPDFFTVPVDDTERAVVLLHESYHLMGAGEEKAFAEVWREKGKLGWTKNAYGHTQLWLSVRAYTERYAPRLFTCGKSGTDDCFE
jgi:hypothetical protein